MLVQEIMSRDVEIASPDDTIQTAAKIMADINAGALPVGENDRLIGMITDRDIAVRAVAEGRAPDHCTVREVMSPELHYVFADDDAAQAARRMHELQVRRLPVMNRQKRLVGILSLTDLGAEPTHATGGMVGRAHR